MKSQLIIHPLPGFGATLKKVVLAVMLLLGWSSGQRVAAQENRNCQYCYLCTIELLTYEPRFLCTSQGTRYFRINNVSSADAANYTFTWEIYSVDITTGVETLKPNLSGTVTGSVLYSVQAYRFLPGMYSYRVRGYVAASSCYTNWAGGALTGNGQTFTVEEDCPDPNDDLSRATNTPKDGLGEVAYPNPASEVLTVPAKAEVMQLRTSAGRAVPVKQTNGKLELQGLPDGLYNLQLRQNGKIITQRIQVKH